MNIKKIALIILFILVSIGLAFLIYTVFFKSPPPPVINNVPEQAGTLPSIDEGGARIIDEQELEVPDLASSDFPKAKDVKILEQAIAETANGGLTYSEQVISNRVSAGNFRASNNQMLYYDSAQQSFYKLTAGGELTKLSNRKFYAVQNVTWSPTKNQGILEYPDETKVLYDFDKDKQLATLPKQMKDFSFSYNGNKLSSKWIGDYSDDNYVISSDPNGANFKFVEPMGDKADDVANVWSPDSEILATYREQIDGIRQEIFFINEYGKNIHSLTVDGTGFEGVWNPSGKKLLYNVFSAKTDFNPVLWVATGKTDELGGGKRYIGLNTWVDKCSFSNTNDDLVYCAVPDYLPTGSGWYPEFADELPYSIYKINVSTGHKERVAEPVVNGTRVSIDQIFLNKGDEKIYYTDSNGYVYDLDL